MYKLEAVTDFSNGEFSELVSEVVLVLKDRLEATDIIRLLQIVFLDVNQAAELFGVKIEDDSFVGERRCDPLSQGSWQGHLSVGGTLVVDDSTQRQAYPA